MKKALHLNLRNSKCIQITCVIATLFFNAVISFGQNDNWQQISSAPTVVTARSGAVSFSIGTKGYICTGYDSAGNYKNDLWEFDVLYRSWTKKANFSGNPRTGAVGFSIDGKGYIGTGRDGNTNYDDFWEYNPVTNSWAQKANFGGGARNSAIGFAVPGSSGSKGIIGTGVDANGNLKNDVWEYNPANDSWIQKSNFPGGARAGAIGFKSSSGNVGYIGTGYDSDGNFKKDIWLYSVGIDMWSQQVDFGGSPRAGAIAINFNNIHGDKIIIIGGYAGSNYFNDYWEYTPTTNTWVQNTNFNWGARSGAICFVIAYGAPQLYIGTGFGPAGYYNDLWRYDGTSWWQEPNLGGAGSARSFATSFSIGGKGYVGTGSDIAGNSRKDFWEYDPATDIWTQLADFGGSARALATGFSIGNKGYIGLGSSFDQNFNYDFWEYDPATNIWTQKANFGGLGKIGAASFSIGNKGYIGTGAYRTQALNDFWEYDPATNIWTQKANFAGPARERATGITIGDKGYIGLGGYNDFWEYDPVLNSWTQKASFGGVARLHATGFGIGNKGYLGLGGFDDFWEYSQALDSWTQKTNFPGGARTAASGFSIDGKGYIGFGNSLVVNSIEELRSDFWKYTPSTIAVPVVFINVKAYEENGSIVVAWTAAEDLITNEYQLEKSSDGIHFYKAGTQKALGRGQKMSYKWIDKQYMGTTSYYRVKAVDDNGEIKISPILMVSPRIKDDITIYPNPITSGVATINISNKKKENYIVRLYNEQGQLINNYTIKHPGGASSQIIYLPFPVLSSYYILKIDREDGEQKTFKVFFAR